MSNREKLFLHIAFLSEEDANKVLRLFEVFFGKKEPKEEPKSFHETVYCIKHNKTGKEYIGRTGCYQNRIKQHMSLLRKGKHLVEDMQADYDKYGEDYTVTVLDEITDCFNRNREYELISEHGSYERGKGYNYNDRCFLCWQKRSRL